MLAKRPAAAVMHADTWCAMSRKVKPRYSSTPCSRYWLKMWSSRASAAALPTAVASSPLLVMKKEKRPCTSAGHPLVSWTERSLLCWHLRLVPGAFSFHMPLPWMMGLPNGQLSLEKSA